MVDGASGVAKQARVAAPESEPPPSSKRPRLSSDKASAAAKAASLDEVLQLLDREKDSLKQDPAALLAVLRRLPDLLAAEVVPAGATAEDLAKRVQAGEALQTAVLPSCARGSFQGEARLWPFEWAQRAYGALLRQAAQNAVDLPNNLESIVAVTTFVGQVRLRQPLHRQLVEPIASELLHWLKQHWGDVDLGSLGLMCRFVRSVACCGTLADPANGTFIHHGLVPALVKAVALALHNQAADARERVPLAAIHDAALALALSRPWPADSVALRAAAALVKTLPKALQLGGAAEAPASAADGRLAAVVAAASQAGMRKGKAKENQDSCFTLTSADSVSGCVIDGHGARGEEVSSQLRVFIEAQLQKLPAGQRSRQALQQLLLAADALALVGGVDTRLCGATCALVCVDAPPAGTAGPPRIVVAHAGDCRVILGRRKESEWKAIRLTKDHVVTDPEEAARIVAAGGCIRCMKPKAGVGATDVAGLGPPRLFSRIIDGAPGLAVSRSLGDALGQSCGVSSEAEAMEAALGGEDLVVVAASDGVFDVMQDGEVLQRCLPFRRARDAAAAAAAVVAASGKAWARQSGGSYCDDMSCVVFFL